MCFRLNTEILLNDFKTIGLYELRAVSLRDRIETKYIIPIVDLQTFLNSISKSHSVLNINNEFLHNYQTFYYDTVDSKMYLDHHNKKANRYKIRIRHYHESNLFFLEIKNKSNKGRTLKKRMPINSISIKNNPEAFEFIKKNSPFILDKLSPVLGNSFRRITLVDNKLTERLTIDINLNVWEIGNEINKKSFKKFAIIELKRDANSIADTHLKLRDFRIKPIGFSKYAISSSILFSDKLKANNFKKKYRIVNKLEQ